jgi:oligopeptide transport system permease protein
MAGFILRRLLWTIPVLWVVLTIVFFMMRPSGWDYSWRNKVLPTITLSLVPMAYFARLLRGTLLETFEADYVQIARAKGLSQRRVVGVHALKNSLLPVIAVAGPMSGRW